MKDEIKRKLNSLREKYVDNDSIDYISQLEKDYSKVLEEKAFLNHPIFLEICKSYEMKLNDINTLLLNDETITEKQRDRLFSERKALRLILNSLGVNIKDVALISLEEIIDSKLA